MFREDSPRKVIRDDDTPELLFVPIKRPGTCPESCWAKSPLRDIFKSFAPNRCVAYDNCDFLPSIPRAVTTTSPRFVPSTKKMLIGAVPFPIETVCGLKPTKLTTKSVASLGTVSENVPSVPVVVPIVVPLTIIDAPGNGSFVVASEIVPLTLRCANATCPSTKRKTINFNLMSNVDLVINKFWLVI